jgi:hypothetical protein
MPPASTACGFRRNHKRIPFRNKKPAGQPAGFFVSRPGCWILERVTGRDGDLAPTSHASISGRANRPGEPLIMQKNMNLRNAHPALHPSRATRPSFSVHALSARTHARGGPRGASPSTTHVLLPGGLRSVGAAEHGKENEPAGTSQPAPRRTPRFARFIFLFMLTVSRSSPLQLVCPCSLEGGTPRPTFARVNLR